MKKIFVAAALALTLVLSACGGQGGKSDTTEVTFLTHWGPDQVQMLEAAAAAYTAINPDVTVKIQAVPFGNLLSTLRTQGSSADGPTIVGIYDAWLPELVRDGLAAKAPADVAAMVKANWPGGLVAAASQGGDVYGVPNEMALYALNYNQALFDQAGIAEPPKTWDETVDAALKISALGADIQGIGFITNWTAGAIHPFLSLLASNGGTFLNADGLTAALDSAAALETAEFYQRLVNAKLTDPTMAPANANTTGPYLDNFASGKTGMLIMANWWQSSITEAMGENADNLRTAPVPVGPSGSGSSSISYSWMTMVNAAATDAKQAAAWSFLDFLNGPSSGANGTSAMGEILLSMGILPTRISDVDANAEALATPFLQTYVDAMATATPFPTVIGGQAAADALQVQVEALLSGQVNAATAMSNAQRDVNAALTAAG